MNQLILRVWRRLDNRFEGLSDDSPRAFELHYRRNDALHEVLENEPLWNPCVLGLKEVDDSSRTHESVALVLQLQHSNTAMVRNIPDDPSLNRIEYTLIQSGWVDAATAEAVKVLIARLHLQQIEEKILNMDIEVPNAPSPGILIRCSPAQQGVTPIMVSLPNGQTVFENYRNT